MSQVSELLEKLSHPTRVKILKLLETSPLNFSQFKSKLGIESSGNLDHHLRKLGDLIQVNPAGVYEISDVGKDAIRAIKSLESSLTVKEAYPVAQSRKILGILLMLLAIFILAVTIMAIAMIPASMTSQQLIGLLGGLIGSILGMLGAAFGLKGAIAADGKSTSQLTYFPSQNDPWMIRDWIVNLLFFGTYLTLMFSLVYAQIFSPNFPSKPLWFTASLFALSILVTTSVVISYRIIEKANRKIERSTRL